MGFRSWMMDVGPILPSTREILELWSTVESNVFMHLAESSSQGWLPHGRRRLMPGDVLTFRYRHYTEDRAPLVLITDLRKEKKRHKNKISGINLHYIPEDRRSALVDLVGDRDIDYGSVRSLAMEIDAYRSYFIRGLTNTRIIARSPESAVSVF